jgi:hypothetical protein
MGKTRKARTYKKQKHDKVLTIPELRSSMEHMDVYSYKLIGTKSLKEAVKLFTSEWKRVFGRSLSSKDAEEYLKNKMKLHKYGKTRRGKHHGGSLLTGAPLNHITRSGDYIPAPAAVYPPLVAKGFWNPEPAILQDAATQKVNPYSTTGNNQALAGGGSLSSSFAAATFRPFIAQNPMTSGYYLQNSMKGLSSGPGANSYDNPGLKI